VETMASTPSAACSTGSPALAAPRGAGWPGPPTTERTGDVMTEQLEERLRAEQGAVRDAVLASARVRTGGDPDHREITEALVAELFGSFLDLLPGGRPGASHDALRQIGARYATARVPHGQVLSEFHGTLIELSRRSWEVADQSDVWVLLQLAQDFEREIDPARSALSEGYCKAFAASGTRSTSRRQLVESLLSGRPVGRRLLLAANVAVADHYLVLCTQDQVPQQSADDLATATGVQGALVHRDGGVLFVLLPASRRSANAPAEEVAARGFATVSGALGATVAAASTSDVATLPEAAEEARAVLDVAVACGRRGAVLAEQVLVERALTGSPAAVAQLAGVVEALAPWPYLSETLRALYDHDLDRSATADALHIARRTLTNRLDRIHQLTGVHPTSARGVQTFMTALAAHRLSGEDDESGRGVG
jgi:hypothetical protein